MSHTIDFQIDSVNKLPRVSRTLLEALDITDTAPKLPLCIAAAIHDSYTHVIETDGYVPGASYTESAEIISKAQIASGVFSLDTILHPIKNLGRGPWDTDYHYHVLRFPRSDILGVDRVILRVKLPIETFFGTYPVSLMYDKFIAHSGRNDKCHVCYTRGTIKSCAGCRTARYCGVECQAGDWDRHKEVCAGLSAMLPMRWLVTDEERLRMSAAATAWYDEIGRGLDWATPCAVRSRSRDLAAALVAEGFESACVDRHMRELVTVVA